MFIAKGNVVIVRDSIAWFGPSSVWALCGRDKNAPASVIRVDEAMTLFLGEPFDGASLAWVDCHGPDLKMIVRCDVMDVINEWLEPKCVARTSNQDQQNIMRAINYIVYHP